MEGPKVSIIIPVFNRQELVKRALDSLCNQTYKQWEGLVIDDGSTDETLKVLETYAQKDNRIKFWSRAREPKGAPTCRNIGLQKAKGDYVIFLDSDDYLLSFCLEHRIKRSQEYPDNDLWIFPTSILEDDNPKKLELDADEDHLKRFISANLPWTIINPLWKADAVRKLKGFKEGYPRFNDPELMIRTLLQDGLKYKVMDQEEPDSVLEPSPKNTQSFHKRVYEGLHLFIPYMVKFLKTKSKSEYTPYLVMYLRLWLKYYYAPDPTGKFRCSLKLINLFFKLGVIDFNKYLSLTGRLVHFHITKFVGLGHRDKLTNAAYYKV